MNQCVQANLVNKPAETEEEIGAHLTVIPNAHPELYTKEDSPEKQRI
jgi:hypothetical protein